ncbi:AraC family transcriptional regulator [Glutamicibacter sp. JL.03c]|uniref:helix-turn-helix domain-containing protein n=1 Tax=Glutamicibacter sp. JL.03c TaxID=2984842 RepID=UPI0021F6C409|nr:AraC family transcriptional regulator [Glutamicibacter sp. JL.03c]UYQ76640.1 AraC family transcriptional regulator [Glutamicibacter sp. JL.03c]
MIEERMLPTYAAGAIDVPFVIGFFQERVQVDTCWPSHSHPTHELLWNQQGVSSVSVGPKTWTITPVLGVWMPAGVLHEGAARADSVCNMSHFGITSVDSIAEEPVPVVIAPLLRLLLERLADPGLTPKSRAITEAAAMDNLQPAPGCLAIHVPQSELLQPIVAEMIGQPKPAPSLQQWADRLGVSGRTISRAFQAETGIGYSRWAGSLHAQQAMEMVAGGEDLQDIAQLLGFSSQSSLGAAFRRNTGFTLSSFRDTK